MILEFTQNYLHSLIQYSRLDLLAPHCEESESRMVIESVLKCSIAGHCYLNAD